MIAEKVIWLPRGLTADEDTNGHIDNIACFAAPAKVILSWTDDQSDPQFAISREALAVLQSNPDARGRNIEVIKIQIPPAMYRTEDDMPVSNSARCSIVGDAADEQIEETERTVGERLAASYANFYIAGEPGGPGGIVCPAFGAGTDVLAAQVLTKCFPGREIVMVPCGREIVLDGGNIHCITQQQPACMMAP
ncbi:hypothetical protein CEUSTIGMA_g7863.t1 [Chlamydomonas eustigma]|uniref:Agmatine deiminase n=1 Tax=Chlamydomonas eustigma TaxID=1157962 RepID=A0A250XBI0_9CHLO|nr:hypothetical protein CEUSTIGMA_g7863.t1 [Chlamydomonas eustigma]|eukprot:GAX80424.1 hypothetical protein CEUSTIGMA_g7863.t1 [Chlamydomonas eustigma]